MKQYFTGALIASFTLIVLSLPTTSQALSCLAPDSMIEYYVTDDNYQIFTATAGETKEYVEQAATTDGDPNLQYDSGYTAQYVEVSESYKGYVDDQQWVYYQKNSTWNYLCAGGPGELGQQTLYVVNPAEGLFDLPQVVNSYPADSELAKNIVAALADSEAEATVQPVTEANWQERLRAEIKEMIFIIRIKLSELQLWSN